MWRAPTSNSMPSPRLTSGPGGFLPLITVGPYVLLGILVLFMVTAGFTTGTSLLIDLALSGLAAAWISDVHAAARLAGPRTADGDDFFIGLVVIMAALVIRDPGSGPYSRRYTFAFSVLRWPWRLGGVAAVAVVAATAQTGGIHRVTPFGVVVYLAVVCINVLPLCGLAWLDWERREPEGGT